MAEGSKGRSKSAAGKGRRKATAAQLKARRLRARERQAEKVAAAEQERRATLSPAELIAEDEQARGAARTVVNGELYKTIMRQWTEGWSYTDLAAKHGLSERRVEQVVEDLRASKLTQLGVGDPLFSVKFAQQLVMQRSAAVSQYAKLAESCTEANQSHIKLGYLKLRDQALTAFTELVQELGWLPRHLGTVNSLMDAMQMAEVLLEVMEVKGVGMDVQEAVVEAIELRVIRRGGRLALAGVGPDLMGQATDLEGGDGGDEDATGRGPGGGASGGDGGSGGDAEADDGGVREAAAA